jgi:hypothetical protein
MNVKIMFYWGAVIIAIVLSLYLSSTVSEREEESKTSWNKMKNEHNCKIIKIDLRDIRSGNYYWLCDDGITYINNFKE